MTLFAHKCGNCGAFFAAELGPLGKTKEVTIRDLCGECEWMQQNVLGHWEAVGKQKTLVRTRAEFVPLTQLDVVLIREE